MFHSVRLGRNELLCVRQNNIYNAADLFYGHARQHERSELMK